MTERFVWKRGQEARVELMAWYEELRRQVLEIRTPWSGQGLGGRLLVRQGMQSWMQVMADRTSALPPPGPSHGDAEVVPCQFRGELVEMLADMVLDRRGRTI